MMQNFSYHTHNNALGIFDGKNSAAEMICQAEKLDFTTIGVSNHLIWHPNMSQASMMFFRDINAGIDVWKRSLDVLYEAAQNYKIRVLAGFEVDFFPSSEWRNGFEKIIKEIKPDYLIGSTHTFRTADESKIYNIYHLDELPQNTSAEDMDELRKHYWINVIESIKSGYFDFIAHLDYCTIFNHCVEEKWNDLKWQVIEALDKRRQPFELNTSGYNRINLPHPHPWMLEELAKRNVPLVLSDDAHYIEHLGQHFDRAEEYLQSINYTSRWSLEK